ncbi:hypothetical protein HY045_00500 [Candidatus Woesebacteria bacterium]|nr:hypothetical protein [Candidatus Woesebacteria bacterium]
MNITDFLPDRTQKDNEFYWAIVLEQGWVQAGIWEVVDQKAIICAASTGVAWESIDQITDATDTVLSSVVQNLPGETKEPSKTVFGLPPSWVSGGAIKEENLSVIKKICADLELSPSGFVVLPEAIAHLLKSEEGAPINAIIIGLGKDEVDITLFQLGTLVGTTSVARSVSLADDAVEGLSRFNPNSPLPSRILIYNGRKHQLEEEKQNLLSADWTSHEKLKFLHTPKIEIIDPNRKILATALAGGAEIAHATSAEGLKLAAEDSLIEETKGEPSVEETGIEDNLGPTDMGFVMDQDIVNVTVPSSPPQINPQPNLSPQNYEVAKPPFTSPLPLRANPLSPIAGVFSRMIRNLFGFLGKMKFTRGQVHVPVTAPNLVFPKRQSKKFFWPLVLLGFLTAAFFLWWVLVPKAEVTVFVSPKKVIQKDIDISIAGTILLSSGGLKFLTDTTASVSAALSPGSPGTVSLNVTASDIGSEYNLAKDEVFKVGNFPKAEVDGVATVDFSGGSSKQIPAISTNDLTTLEKDLTQELSDQAKSQIESQLASGKIMIDDSFVVAPSAKTFSGKQGDESSSLKLKMSLKAEVLTIQKSQIFDLVSKLLVDKISKGFILRSEQVRYLFSKKGEKGSLVNFNMEVDANLLPETKPEDIAKKITGKTPQKAQEYLTTIPGFSRVEIKLKPKIPFGLGRIPFLNKNIMVEVSSEK